MATGEVFDPGALDIDNEFVSIIRGLGEEYVDTDLAPQTPQTEPREYDLEDDGLIKAHADIIDLQTRSPHATPERLINRLAATAMLLGVAIDEALPEAEQSITPKVPYATFYQQVMGTPPPSFSEDELRTDAKEVKALLQDLGMEWADPETQQAIKEKLHLKLDENALASYFKAIDTNVRPKVQALVGGENNTAETRFFPFPDEDPTATWLHTVDRKLVLDVNTGPMAEWTAGLAFQAVGHELTHDPDLHNRQKKSEAGLLLPSDSLLIPFTPDMTQMETVAIAAAHIIIAAETQNPEYQYQTAFQRFYTKVINNAHAMVNGEYRPDDREEVMDAAINYVKQWVPFDDTDKIRSSLESRRDYAIPRAYYASYGVGTKLADDIIALSPDQQKAQLRRLMYTPMSAPDFVKALKAATARAA